MDHTGVKMVFPPCTCAPGVPLLAFAPRKVWLLRHALVFALLMVTVFAADAARPANPGKREDAAAEREKMLSTIDKIEVLETNQEITRAEMAEMKAEMERLKAENAALRSALEKSEQARLKEREILLEEVGKMIAANSAGAKKAGRATSPKSTGSGTTARPQQPQGDGASGPADKPATATAGTGTGTGTVKTRPASESGFHHVVQKGQSLTLIAQAFREQGVNVSVDDIVKANELSSREVRPGQKLFIPKK
ncbi:hypothetical protein DB346_09485 [Verrucomicrobia bacterium LW23]|nr:hypothetical protein DB346_09485 [Verrucomicrobia bacterium LW23]